MKRQRFNPDQGTLLGYISPIDGSPVLHPPLCACGACPMPVERFTTNFEPDYFFTVGHDERAA